MIGIGSGVSGCCKSCKGKMDLLLEFLIDTCALGLYRWLGRHIYGPVFVDKNKKQPLHRRMLVAGMAFFIALAMIFVFVFLILEIIGQIHLFKTPNS
jgi:hypothetical protein